MMSLCGAPWRPVFRRVPRRLCALAAALALAGCAATPIEALYTIHPPTEFPSLKGRSSAQFLIAEPAALQGLATTKIAVRPTPSTLSYYKNVAWEDTVPNVFQAMLLDTFQNSKRVGAVGLPGQSLLIDYQVVTEIRAFQADVAASSNFGRVQVSVKLLNDKNGHVVASRVFETLVPLRGEDAVSAADGIDKAARLVATDILRWTLSKV